MNIFCRAADDYITKPFSPKEVAYRVKAHLRRNNYMGEDNVKKDKIITFGPFELNKEKVELKKSGELIELKAKEFKMLAYIAKYPNQILSKEKICSEVWGEDYIGFDNTIMVHIRRLREKIEDNSSTPQYIVNIKGLGLNDPKNAEVDIDFICDNEVIEVFVDDILIMRTIKNLLYNAIVHNEEGINIKVLVEKKDNLRIVISDNGKGIKPEELKHIFERYYRGTNTGKGHEGSGLGMAIANDIVKAHDGEIKILSEIGRGTEIEIHI